MRGSAEYWWKVTGSLKFCGNLSFFLFLYLTTALVVFYLLILFSFFIHSEQ
ncbi:unnamed protein product [Tenebrio molitor]|nr:unnamed protein product [Tenebrio molitor]